MKEFQLARTKFSTLINKFIKEGVLYELKGIVGNKATKVTKTLILNPTLARRTQIINKNIMDLFKPLNK